MEIGYPDIERQPLWGWKNIRGAILVLLVPLPAIATAAWLFAAPTSAGPSATPEWSQVESLGDLRRFLLGHPVLAANVLYFVFVDVVFFAVALVQRSSWLIDPYWTLLPLLLAWFYLAHPGADPSWARVVLAWGPLLIWSVRLTANYFRREGWRFGLREDWRYAKMRRERPLFWLEQFFVVHLAQHGMLVGLSLPFYVVAFRPDPIGAVEIVLSILAVSGIAIAGVADNQLDRFMRANAERASRGEAGRALLDDGLWRYSRHPNYFGEQLFWWSIAGFGIHLGEAWVAVGTLFNSCILASVTVMTERRMLAVPSRAAVYADYQRRTSVWIPWPPRSEGATEAGERTA